jgi:hypothetical protein
LRKFEKSVFRQWPAPATFRRRVFQAFAAMITLPFLAGSTACERHGNAADEAAAAHPAPSSSPLASASPGPVLLADSATPAATTPAETATATATAAPAATTPTAAASASPEPSAAAGNSAPSPTPVRPPHFASAEANEYVQTYEAYIQNFRAAYIRMMKDADLSEYGRLIAQAQELQARGEQIQEELDPSEREALGKYLDAKAEEVRRITSQAL